MNNTKHGFRNGRCVNGISHGNGIGDTRVSGRYENRTADKPNGAAGYYPPRESVCFIR